MVSQIDATLETLKDYSGEAIEAVQHGVEVISTKLTDLVEPKRKASKSRWWMWMLLAFGLVAVAAIVAKRRAAHQEPAAVVTPEELVPRSKKAKAG
jgi:hypothetical protein